MSILVNTNWRLLNINSRCSKQIRYRYYRLLWNLIFYSVPFILPLLDRIFSSPRWSNVNCLWSLCCLRLLGYSAISVLVRQHMPLMIKLIPAANNCWKCRLVNARKSLQVRPVQINHTIWYNYSVDYMVWAKFLELLFSPVANLINILRS